MPGAGGGANWHGAAVDPETGWLYVPSRTSPTVVQLIIPDPSRSDFRYMRGARAVCADRRACRCSSRLTCG